MPGEHDHRGLIHRCWRDRAQCLEQQVGVVGHRRDAVLAEQFGKQPHHHLAVFEHVAHAAGHAQVVFEHVVAATAVGLGGADDVDAGDVRVDAARHVDAHHLGAELRVAQDLLGRHMARLDDLLAVIDVVDETVQRAHPLRQALFHLGPFVRRDDARDQVERDQAFVARVLRVRFFVLGAVHGEGDAHPAKDHLGFLAARQHHIAGLLRQPTVVAAVVLAHGAGIGAHFVEAGFHGRVS